MLKNRLVVTVDGLAASGKSALAEGLARHLGFAHLNTGLLYRSVAWLLLEDGGALPPPESLEDALVRSVSEHDIRLMRSPEHGEPGVCVDGRFLKDELTSVSVSRNASVVASNARLRELLLSAQRDAYPGEGLVAEGRDMGTVVFPDASVKFFVSARSEVRAARRLAQLAAKGSAVTLPEVESDLTERDLRDSSRAVAPMRAASDAYLIDNSDEPLLEVIARMVRIVRDQSGAREGSV